MRPQFGSLRTRKYVCSSCLKALRRQRRAFATAAIEKPDVYDVVCVGGGPAGLSLLTALRASPITSSLNIALVESQKLETVRKWSLPPDQFSNRASSLTPTSKAFLSSIGAWQHVDRIRTQPYHQMQVWDGLSDARIEFDWSSSKSGQPMIDPDEGGSTIATMIENNNITRALLARLSNFKDFTTIYDNTNVSSISYGAPSLDSSSINISSYPHLRLSSTTKTIAARLLIGADGLNSPVRQFANIPSRGWDYNRHGLVATLKLQSPRLTPPGEAIAYQRFLPTGPVALLALPNGYATLVWSTMPETAARLKGLGEENFCAMVDAAFRLSPVDVEYLTSISSGQKDQVSWRENHTEFDESRCPTRVISLQPGSRASFPLRMRHADTYISHRVALIGDAAHTIHPLAGQGLNQGIGDVQSLVKTIEYAVSHGADIGTETSLESYNAERWSANNRLLGTVDKLHKLYSVRSGPVVGLRSWGLGVINQTPLVKDFFMRQAAGNGL
ncbi:MAG: putative ubiquinone biosynthesis monooxygenase [Icmadophila ericetorum]|nr:putative ubiquinone biosynthesis monooxygenase [Icmadophila ericetorum]